MCGNALKITQNTSKCPQNHSKSLIKLKKAICLSPGIIYRDQDYYSQLIKTKTPKNLRLAIVNGTDNFDKNLQYGVDKFISYLKSIDFSKKNYMYWIEKDGTHSSKSWSKQAKKTIEWLY